MITIKDVLSIHSILIEQFGGTPGIRDEAGVESALARPFMSFENVELYPTPEEKASAILESIINRQ